eukprot:CAMPEP_0172789834 /NCGR_PEP_ID=MMETSP1074-20121228/207655_1 /TAXON_ID=2916 /ORGANISM="Ceratium fusus, Strain PA161109" /LENGTH=262 /DNA_ID=CAMNT_0013626875 /DNA_START=249 /DNA_END=1038 /DNA_ORIENTATION=+
MRPAIFAPTAWGKPLDLMVNALHGCKEDSATTSQQSQFPSRGIAMPGCQRVTKRISTKAASSSLHMDPDLYCESMSCGKPILQWSALHRVYQLQGCIIAGEVDKGRPSLEVRAALPKQRANALVVDTSGVSLTERHASSLNSSGCSPMNSGSTAPSSPRLSRHSAEPDVRPQSSDGFTLLLCDGISLRLLLSSSASTIRHGGSGDNPDEVFALRQRHHASTAASKSASRRSPNNFRRDRTSGQLQVYRGVTSMTSRGLNAMM